MYFPFDDETAAAHITDGTTWDEFCDTLKAAGAILQRPGTPSDPFTRAEGHRYLTRLLRAALQTFVEHADPKAPVLQRVVHETAKMGADNPDNHYLNAAVSGEHTYVLRGKRNTVHFLEFATQRGHYGQGRGMPPTGHLDADALTLDEDGRLTITLSVERPPTGDWLPMQPDTGTLIIRQSRLDPAHEELAELTLERVGGDGLPSPVTPRAIDAGLRASALLVHGAASIFAEWAEGFARDHVNRLPRFDQALSDSMGGVPWIWYSHSYWRLAPDEALVIEATPPPCDHWNFQLNNHWMESLDYRYHRVHVNSKTAVPEPDGSIRVIVAHDDPGHPNWIRTAGHTFGTMCWRWVKPAGEAPEPTCRVVKLTALRG